MTGAGREGPAPEGPSRREAFVVAAVALIVAALSLWPVTTRITTHVAPDLGDPVHDSWSFAWAGHTLPRSPGSLFQTNSFWPHPDSGAYTDLMLGWSPLAVPGEGPRAAVLRYNVFTLLTFAGVALATYALARELRLTPGGAAVAAAVATYFPYRTGQLGHIQVLAGFGIPLALFLLVRGHRRRNPWLVAGGWCAAAWQVTLSIGTGVFGMYLLGAIALLAAPWVWRNRTRGVLAANVAGVALLGATALVLAQPYERVVESVPGGARSRDQVEFFSPPPAGWLAAPYDNLLWGPGTAPVRDRLGFPIEQTLFPGVTAVVLAAFGLASPAFPRRQRAALAAGVVVTGLVALGFSGPFGGALTFEPLWRWAPGWDAVRTPGRVSLLTSYGLALLAGAGTHLLARRMKLDVTFASLAIAGLVVLEGTRIVPVAEVPVPPAIVAAAPAPQVHLPMELDVDDALYMYFTVDGFPEVVNGYGSLVPPLLEEVRKRVRAFPDEASVAFLRDLGVRSVLLHTNLADGTAWEDAPERTVEGVTPERHGDVVLWRLTSS